jgi:hypothetical protein
VKCGSQSSSSSQLLKLPSHNNKPKFPARLLQKSQHNSRFLAQPRTPTKNSQKAPIPAKLQAEEETELETHHNNNNKNKKPKTLEEKKIKIALYSLTHSLTHSAN